MFKKIIHNEEIDLLIKKGNDVLGVLGFTEHSRIHAAKVSETAGRILKELGCDEHTIELAKIAGFMHDIGNSINRHEHAQTGALLAYPILKDLEMPLEDAITVSAAIGNHDESTGVAIDAVSAALIIADKTDVRRNRVRNTVIATFDAHDRVNYAVLDSTLTVDAQKKIIQMDMTLDESMCTVLDYFEIFLDRMVMCRRAAEKLGCKFKLRANGSKLC